MVPWSQKFSFAAERRDKRENFSLFTASLIALRGSSLSTRPHDTDTVTFSNVSTLEIVFESLRFHRKRYIVFVWTGHENATKCLRFQMKTHPCGRGLRKPLAPRVFLWRTWLRKTEIRLVWTRHNEAGNKLAFLTSRIRFKWASRLEFSVRSFFSTRHYLHYLGSFLKENWMLRPRTNACDVTRGRPNTSEIGPQHLEWDTFLTKRKIYKIQIQHNKKGSK